MCDMMRLNLLNSDSSCSERNFISSSLHDILECYCDLLMESSIPELWVLGQPVSNAHKARKPEVGQSWMKPLGKCTLPAYGNPLHNLQTLPYLM